MLYNLGYFFNAINTSRAYLHVHTLEPENKKKSKITQRKDITFSDIHQYLLYAWYVVTPFKY